MCWELLKLICGGTPPTLLRGCHSTIYPVELPQWIPNQIVEDMTGLIRVLLRRELEYMVRNAQDTNNAGQQQGQASYQSIISVATPVGDPEVNAADMQMFRISMAASMTPKS